MIIEIGYSYQLDKTSPIQQSWTYFYIKDGDEDKAKKKARTHFKKWITELGWTKQAKVTQIEVIKDEKSYFPEHIIVSKSELPPARKRRSTPQTPQKKPSRAPRTRRVSGKS